MSRIITAAALLALSGFLSACGGGDTPVTIPPNDPPRFTSVGTVTLVENAALSYQATATDPNGDTLTYSIGGGPDAARFSINASGLLNFLAAPDADNPADADADNVYQVTLSVSDGKTTASLPLSVTVTNSREGIAVRRIFSGFNGPVAMAAIPGDTRVFVAEERGNIYYFDPATGTRTFYARMEGLIFSALGIAVSPNYATDGLLYYSWQTSRGSELHVLERAKVEAGVPASTNILTIRVVDGPYAEAGWLGFGPDNNLYFATGADREINPEAQMDDNYNGKIVRVRRNSTPGASPQYTLEIVAKGLVSPASATFVGNTLLVGEQGLIASAEVNRFDVTGAVANFGWPFRDGATRNPHFPEPEPAGLIDPALDIPNPMGAAGPRESQSLIAGPVYNGPIASLNGQMILGDRETGSIWTIAADRLLGTTTSLTSAALAVRKTDFTPDAGTIDAVSAFLLTTSGKLLILDYDGEIFEVLPST